MKKKGIILAVSCMLGIAGTWSYVEASTKTLYQVTLHDQVLGHISTPDLVTKWLIEAQGHPIDIIEISRFKGKSEDEKVIRKLKEHADSHAVAILINNNTVGYVKTEKEAEQVFQDYTRKYEETEVEDEKVNVKHGNETVSVFKEEVKLEQKHVSPDLIMTQEEIMKELSLGTAKQVKHRTQEGESLWTLAEQYRLTVEEIIQMNPSLDGERLQIGQELNVKQLVPWLTVVTSEEVRELIDIPFSKEIKKDPNRPRGEQKTIQEGKVGQKSVTYRVVKENGMIESRKIVSEEIIQSPIPKIIVEGSKILLSRGSGQYVWPTNGSRITSAYGPRWGKEHKGLDIIGSDLKIKAADSGVVILSEWDGDYGKSIVIDHKNGQQTRYAHLDEILVKKGQVVQQGQQIGVMGTTGDSTGVHLHFEIFRNGQQVNPLQLLRR